MTLLDARKDYLEHKERYDAYIKECGFGNAFDISKLVMPGSNDYEKLDNYRLFLEDFARAKSFYENFDALSVDKSKDIASQMRMFRKGAVEALKAAKSARNYNFKYRHEFEDVKTALSIGAGDRPADARITTPIYTARHVLDRINVTTNNSSVVVHYEITGGSGNVRPRSGGVWETPHQFRRQSVQLKPIGAWQPVGREIFDDPLRFENSVIDQLIADVQSSILLQFFTGDGSGNNWSAFNTKVTSVVASNQIRTYTEVIDDIRSHAVRLLSLGVPVSAIIMAVEDVNDVLETLGQLRLGINVSESAPLGSIIGIPIVAAPFAKAHSFAIGPFSSRMEIALTNALEVQSSEGQFFHSNELAMRAVVEGESLFYHGSVEFVHIQYPTS